MNRAPPLSRARAPPFPQPPAAVSSWVRSLPLAEVIIDALPRPPAGDARHRLRAVAELSADELRLAARGAAAGLERLLREGVAELRVGFRAYDARLAASEALRACAARKFEVPPAMKCGTIDDFHAGLEGRIGP